MLDVWIDGIIEMPLICALNCMCCQGYNYLRDMGSRSNEIDDFHLKCCILEKTTKTGLQEGRFSETKMNLENRSWSVNGQ